MPLAMVWELLPLSQGSSTAATPARPTATPLPSAGARRCINRGVFDVMEHAWRTKRPMAGLPSQEELRMPPQPTSNYRLLWADGALHVRWGGRRTGGDVCGWGGGAQLGGCPSGRGRCGTGSEAGHSPFSPSPGVATPQVGPADAHGAARPHAGLRRDPQAQAQRSVTARRLPAEVQRGARLQGCVLASSRAARAGWGLHACMCGCPPRPRCPPHPHAATPLPLQTSRSSSTRTPWTSAGAPTPCTPTCRCAWAAGPGGGGGGGGRHPPQPDVLPGHGWHAAA